MLAIERKQCIRQMVQEEKTVKVTMLSEKFGVTEETIRRDLEKLEQEGILKRTYGGAVICDFTSEDEHQEFSRFGFLPTEVNYEDMPFNIRQKNNLGAKQKIAKKLVKSFQQGEVIMLDASTTTLEVARSMGSCKNITVISNGLSAIIALSENERIHVISTGGILRSRSLSFVGPTAKENIKKYYADKVIISCKGADLERGMMDTNELEIEIKCTMMENAREVILAIDHEKIEQRAIYQMRSLNQISSIYTDQPLPKEWEQYCRDHEITVVVADE